MIGVKVSKVIINHERLERAKQRMRIRGLFRWAGFLRTVARRSIRRRKKTSSPGMPPSTQTGRLRDSLIFHVFRDEGRAVVGPDAGEVSVIGQVHEFGGNYKGGSYPARPFMGPALEKTNDKAASFFENEFK